MQLIRIIRIELLLVIYFCLINPSFSQMNIYETSVYLNCSPYKIVGAMYSIKDSSIYVSSSLDINDYFNELNGFSFQEIAVSQIDKIQIRPYKKRYNGFLIGGITGFIIGGILGYSTGDDHCSGWFPIFCFTGQQKFFLYGIPSAFPGSVLGMIIGSIKSTYIINGKMENFTLYKKKIKKKSFMR